MENTLQVPKFPEHGYNIIAVAGERIKQGLISDLKYLESNGQKYEIIDRIEILKGQQIPSVLMLLSRGRYVDSQEYFSFYTKSKNVNFFICLKVESNMN